jgi:hypothetical protein
MEGVSKILVQFKVSNAFSMLLPSGFSFLDLLNDTFCLFYYKNIMLVAMHFTKSMPLNFL